MVKSKFGPAGQKERTMTDKEKMIIEKMNHPVYTVDFLEEWIYREDSVLANPVAALQAMGAKGFYEAVKAFTELESNEIGMIKVKVYADYGSDDSSIEFEAEFPEETKTEEIEEKIEEKIKEKLMENARWYWEKV